MKKHTCNCREWQSSDYPCTHDFVIILAQSDDSQIYVKSFFTLNVYRQTYNNAIFHPLIDDYSQSLNYSPATISDSENYSEENSEEDMKILLPPNIRHSTERSSKRRMRSQSERNRDLNIACHTQYYTRCIEVGYSKRN